MRSLTKGRLALAGSQCKQPNTQGEIRCRQSNILIAVSAKMDEPTKNIEGFDTTTVQRIGCKLVQTALTDITKHVFDVGLGPVVS